MAGFFKKIFGGGRRNQMAEPEQQPKKDVLQSAQQVFGFEIIKVHGKNAWAEWQKIRSEGDFYPVILGPEHELEYLSENFEYQDETDLSGVDDLAFPDLYLEELKIEARQYDVEDTNGYDLQLAVDGLLKDWTDEPYSDGLVNEPTVSRNFGGKYHKEVYIAKVPTDDWTTIPAIMRFGGFNECPSNEWHASALRYWRGKYDAEIVSLTHDIIELRVRHRPKNKQEAVRLAMEQYYYCSDIVAQGVGEPNNLAKILMQQDFWYFWWD